MSHRAASPFRDSARNDNWLYGAEGCLTNSRKARAAFIHSCHSERSVAESKNLLPCLPCLRISRWRSRKLEVPPFGFARALFARVTGWHWVRFCAESSFSLREKVRMRSAWVATEKTARNNKSKWFANFATSTQDATRESKPAPSTPVFPGK